MPLDRQTRAAVSERLRGLCTAQQWRVFEMLAGGRDVRDIAARFRLHPSAVHAIRDALDRKARQAYQLHLKARGRDAALRAFPNQPINQ